MDSNQSALSTDSYEGLYCPECDYSLEGLPHPRCPECGTPFDPDVLRRRQGSQPAAVDVWMGNGQSPGWFIGFLKVLGEMLRRPKMFARSLPARSTKECPLVFCLLSRGMYLLFASVLIAIWGDDLFTSLVFFFAWSVVFNLCLSILCRHVCTTFDAYRFDSWWQWVWLMEYASVFVLIELAVFSATIRIGIYADEMNIPMGPHWLAPLLVIGPSLSVALAWWFYLGRLINARCRGTGVVLIRYLGIPILAGMIAVGISICIELLMFARY